MSLFGSRYKRPDTSQWQMQGGLVQAPDARMEKEAGFWQGGDHFGGRDAIAGILAAIGDAFARQSGGEGWATQNLMGGRLSAIEMAKKAQQQQALMQAAQRKGLSADDVMLQQGGIDLPKPEEPTAFMRNEQYVGQKYGQDAGRAYAAPALYGTAQGPDGRYYPKTTPHLDPNEWEPIDEGGPTSPASGNFPRTRPHYRY